VYLISACLLGENCKYDGGNNLTDWVLAFAEKHSFMPVCPEVAGGLSVPRHPCEIRENASDCATTVVNDIGEDVTDAFFLGAEETLRAAQKEARARGEKIEGAILKKNSPSCGSGSVYDGTFSHTIVGGDGIFVRRLREIGIPVWHEERKDYLL
jgi:uncharacterized protein YbbK (DUF523 family)